MPLIQGSAFVDGVDRKSYNTHVQEPGSEKKAPKLEQPNLNPTQ